MIHTIVAFGQECQISSMDNSNQDKAEFKGKKEGNPTASQAIAGIQKGIILPQHFPRPLPDPRPICKIWLSFPEPPLPSGGIHVCIQIRVLEVTISGFFQQFYGHLLKNFRKWIDRFLGEQISSYIFGFSV